MLRRYGLQRFCIWKNILEARVTVLRTYRYAILIIFVAVMLYAALPAQIAAQEPTGASITGTVADATGRTVKAAAVMLKSRASGAIPQEKLRAILTAFPRLAFKDEFKGCLCNVVRQKPMTAVDNILRDFGIRYVEGFTTPNFADLVAGAPFSD
jgi:hypothetical protein